MGSFLISHETVTVVNDQMKPHGNSPTRDYTLVPICANLSVLVAHLVGASAARHALVHCADLKQIKDQTALTLVKETFQYCLLAAFKLQTKDQRSITYHISGRGLDGERVRAARARNGAPAR